MSILRLNIKKNKVDNSLFKEIFDIKELPLTNAYVELEVKNISLAFINAIRRVITDEMLGYALTVDFSCFDTVKTTDVFMLPQFVNQRIELMPLKPTVYKEDIKNLEFKLDKENKTTSIMSVYSGDLTIVKGKLSQTIFNPTFKICILQPNKRIVINNIKITSGYGRNNAKYMVARCGTYHHLDIPMYSDDEINKQDGVAHDLSGYKISCMVSDPRHHLLSFTIPACSNINEIKPIIVMAFINIKDRLNNVLQAISDTQSKCNITYNVIKVEGVNEGNLQILGETHTIGELLKRSVYDFDKDISYVAYNIVPHENRLNFTIRCNSDVNNIFKSTIKQLITTLDNMQKNIIDIAVD